MIDTLNNTEFWRNARYYLIDTLTGKETMDQACKIGAAWLNNCGVETDIYDKNYMDKLSTKIWSGKRQKIRQCTLPACIIQKEMNAGRAPCDGCNEDRNICRGGPKKELSKKYPKWLEQMISDRPELDKPDTIERLLAQWRQIKEVI